MSHDTLEELEKNKTNPKKVVYFLTQPDAYFKMHKEHKAFLDKLSASTYTDVVDLFITLNKYWDHLNYCLLEKLIMSSRINTHMDNKKKHQDLQTKMKKYENDMDVFMRRTHIDTYCKVVVKHVDTVPKAFRELVTEAELLKMITVYNVEDFRLRLAPQYKLHQCLEFLKDRATWITREATS